MSFTEFLEALNEIPLLELMQNADEDNPIDDAFHNKLVDLLKTYQLIGGMPQVVDAYVQRRDLNECMEILDSLLVVLRDDFAKYTPHVDTLCLDAVFLNVAKSVGEQLKYTRLNDGHSGQMNRKAIDLLVKARVIHKIPSCDPTGLPLGATANPKKFKASMLDIGLLQRLCQVPVELELQQENLLAMYRGKLAEQFVAQELLAWHSSELHYWARDARGSSAEVDYLAVRQGEIYPVEVKSGTGGSLRSLHLMLKKYLNCPKGLVLYSGTYKNLPEQKITFLPLYCAATIGDRRPTVT
jgi:predicted AAA+ superfamily ATPase